MVDAPLTDVPAEAQVTPEVTALSSEPNYHIFLWPEPPGTPPTYLCLLCEFKDCTQAEILVHMPTVHAVDAVPTPLAAQPEALLPPVTEGTPDV